MKILSRLGMLALVSITSSLPAQAQNTLFRNIIDPALSQQRQQTDLRPTQSPAEYNANNNNNNNNANSQSNRQNPMGNFFRNLVPLQSPGTSSMIQPGMANKPREDVAVPALSEPLAAEAMNKLYSLESKVELLTKALKRQEDTNTELKDKLTAMTAQVAALQALPLNNKTSLQQEVLINEIAGTPKQLDDAVSKIMKINSDLIYKHCHHLTGKYPDITGTAYFP